MLHCDLRVRWKVASDLRFRAAISEPKTPSFCGISGDLAQSTRKSLAIAIVRFWCAKVLALPSDLNSRTGLKGGVTERGVFACGCQHIVSPHGRALVGRGPRSDLGFPCPEGPKIEKIQDFAPGLKLSSVRDSGTTTKYSKWHFPAEKSVDFPPWGLMTFGGNPVICAVKHRFPHPESGKIIAESCSGLFV